MDFQVWIRGGGGGKRNRSANYRGIAEIFRTRVSFSFFSFFFFFLFFFFLIKLVNCTLDKFSSRFDTR